MIFLDISKISGITNDVKIVNINKDRVSKIPEDRFVIFANILVNKSVAPRKKINILLLFLPNTFLKHSDDRFRNISCCFFSLVMISSLCFIKNLEIFCDVQ